MDPLEFSGIVDFNAQQVVRTSCHQEALVDLRMLSHRRLEAIEIVFCLPFKCDLDDHGDPCFGVSPIHERRIAPDGACLFHQLDPSQAGRGRKADFGGEARIAHSRIEPEEPKDVAVNRVQSRHCRSF